MNNVSIFWLQLPVSISIFALSFFWYVWPTLKKLPHSSALIALLFVHIFRYVAMTLMVPGMVDPKLSEELLSNMAYGDLIAAGFACFAIIALKNKWSFGVILAWVFNTYGLLDLLSALRTIVEVNLPSYYLGSMWFVFTFYAPLVAISHVMIFWVLLKSKTWTKM